ncbi:MAG: hypothetical protein D6826_08725, partial [Alphaproteobacteria bacterium]
RLDVYPGAGGFDDDPDYQPAPNFLSGLVPQSTPLDACTFDPEGGGSLTVAQNPYLGPGRHPPNGTAPLDHMGYPRDTCAYPAADGSAPPHNCIAVPPAGSDLAPGTALGTGQWDLETYLAFHHPDVAFPGAGFNVCASNSCRLGDDATVDRDGDGRLSRWEVYRWEATTDHPPRLGRAQCFAAGVALPQPPFDPARRPDRRLLGAVVVNCNAAAASGVVALERGGVPLAGHDPVVNLFLSEAAGELAADHLYLEIVPAAAIDGVPALRRRDRVVLRE